MTMKEMCETIVEADILRFNGVAPTALEIYNYSPTGELCSVFDWFEQAKVALNCRAELAKLSAQAGLPLTNHTT